MAETAETTDYSDWFPGVDTSKHEVVTFLVTGNIPTNKTDEVLAVFNEKLTAAINAESRSSGSSGRTGRPSTTWLWPCRTAPWTWSAPPPTGWMPGPTPRTARSCRLRGNAADYCPKTYASVSQAHWNLCKYNGDIYLIPEDNYAQWTNHGFLYRGDWAKAAGLENGVNSWEELGTYFRYIKDTYPDVVPWAADGSGSSYSDQLLGGWAASKDGTITIEGFSAPLFMGTSKEDPYTLSTFYTEGDSLVNFAKLMKQWSDAGYWREDVLNYTGDVLAEMKEGLTGADQHHTQTWRGQKMLIEKEQPGSDIGFFWFGEESSTLVSLNFPHGALAIAAQSDSPERALMAYDLIRNDPTFYRLFNYRIEGEQYIIDENGYMARPASYTDDTVDGVSFDFWWGRNDNLELRSALVDWPSYDPLLEKYNPVKIDNPYGQVVFETDDISVELDNLSNVFRTYAPVICFGKADDPRAYVAEFRQALKDAGIDTVMANVQAHRRSLQITFRHARDSQACLAVPFSSVPPNTRAAATAREAMPRGKGAHHATDDLS
jgi:hypothetical protein